jgi:hypothetical protein
MMGLLLGGAAAAAATIWNSPQSGKKTREQIAEKIEAGLFTLLGAGEATMARVLTPEAPAPAVTASVETEEVAVEPVVEPVVAPVNPAAVNAASLTQ